MKLKYQIVFLGLSLFAAGLTGCKSGSVVSDSPTPAGAVQTSTSSASAVQTSTSQASLTNGDQAQKPTPTPTMLPIMRQAQANPGVPVSVPESMRRPLNTEEMKKAMDQLPPEVRARIQGMQAAPPSVKPQATPKK